MQTFIDFVQENMDTMPDADWQRAYFARFRLIRSKEEMPHFMQELQQANADCYHRQEISPKAGAYLSFIWHTLDACTQDKDCPFEEITYLCGTLVQGMLTDEMAQGFVAALEADRQRLLNDPELLAQAREHSPELLAAPTGEFGRIDLLEMPLKLMQTLLRRRNMWTVRQLIIRLYTAYEAALGLLVNEAAAEEAWLTQVCDTLPLLLLKNFVPLQDRTRSQAPLNVIVNADQNMAPSLEEEASYLLSPLFQQLFSEEEIKEFQALDQHITQTFANLYPLTYINRPRLFACIREDVQRIAQQEGREAGLKQAAIYHQAQFYIPRYFYVQLSAELSQH